MVEVQITSVTGSGLYDIYLCDPYFSYCQLISGSTAIPPTISFVLEGFFLGLTSIIIKLVDSNGCEIFHPYVCPVTPTPTPTLTPTPTPTSTPGCHCITFENLSTGSTETDIWLAGDAGLGSPSSTYVNLYNTHLSLNDILDISYTSFTNTDQSTLFSDILTHLAIPENVYLTLTEVNFPQNSSLIQITGGTDLGNYYSFSGNVISGGGEITYDNELKLRFYLEGFSGYPYNFQFKECNGDIFYDYISPLNILYFCGSDPIAGDDNVIVTIGNSCIVDVPCPTIGNVEFCLEGRYYYSEESYIVLANVHFIPNGFINNRVSWISDFVNGTPNSTTILFWNPITFRWEISGSTSYSISTSVPPINQWYTYNNDPNIFKIVGNLGDCPPMPTPSPTPTPTITPTITLTPTITPTNTPTPSSTPVPCWYSGFSLTEYSDISNGDSVSYYFQDNGTTINGQPSFSSLPPLYNIFYSGGTWVVVSYNININDGPGLELNSTSPLYAFTGEGGNNSIDVYCGNFSEPVCLTLETTEGIFYYPSIFKTVSSQKRYELYDYTGSTNNYLYYSGSSWVLVDNSTNIIIQLTGLTSNDKPLGTWISNSMSITGATTSLGQCEMNLFSCTCVSVTANTDSDIQYLDCNKDIQSISLSGSSIKEYCIISQFKNDTNIYEPFISTISGSTSIDFCSNPCP